MDPEFTNTRHQTPRGARADADVANQVYLIKNVSELRLTYQVRMLAYVASTKNKKLVIRLPKAARVHASLSDFIRENSRIVSIERT